jgi:NADH-quinone oxidoreductase subunit G
MVTFKIDGREIETPDGLSVLEAARREGILIPSFCYHEATGMQGACRLCLVEIDNRVVTSCQTPVEEGMEVLTDTGGVISARSKQIEFILLHHPIDCPVCDEGGGCRLQEMTFLFGPRHRRYRGVVRKYKSQYMGPFIEHVVTRCVQCALCVRFYQDVAGGTDFATLNVADKVYFGRYEEGRLTSEFSGNIIEMCPTGTLLDKTFLHQARVWDLKTAPSVCPHCSCGCNTLPGSRMGRLLRIRNRFNEEVNGYFNCDLGRFGYGFVNEGARIREPMLKRGDGFTSLSWEEAIGLCVERLKGIIERDGPAAVGILGSTRGSNEANYLLRKLFKRRLDCNNIDSFGDPIEGHWSRTAWEILKRGYGRTTTMREIEDADFILIAGVDVTNELPVMELRFRKAVKNGASVGIINHKGTKIDNVASVVLNMRPEEIDMTLDAISGRLLDSEGLTDKIEKTGFAGWNGFFDRVKELERVVKEIEDVCLGLEGCKKPVIISGVRHCESVANLALILEIMKGAPPGLNFAFKGCNTLGVLEMGLSPGEGGMDIKGMVSGAIGGSLKGLFVMENDLLSHYPDRSRIDEAIRKIEFLAVQDTVLTPTAERAHLILPSSSHFETSGTFMNYEGRVQRFSKVFGPVEEARPAWKILKELSVRMGFECDFNSPLEVMEGITGEIEPLKGMDYDSIGHVGKRCSIPGGEKGFYPVTKRVGPPPQEFPYNLITGRLIFGSEDLSNRTRVMSEVIPPVFVEVNGKDAEAEGIRDGEEVLVRSVKGELKARAKVSKLMPSRVVFIPEGLLSGPANRLLTEDGRDFVRLEK